MVFGAEINIACPAIAQILVLFQGLMVEGFNLYFLHLGLVAALVLLVILIYRVQNKRNTQHESLLEKHLEELKKSNLALDETRHQLKLRDKFLQEAMVLIDENGIVYYLNNQAAEIFGQTPEKILYHPLPAWVRSEARNPLNTTGKLKPGLNYSSMAQCSVGEKIYLFKTKWSFFPTREGKDGAAVVFIDFSELLEAEKRSQQLLIEKNEINKQLNCLFDICDVSGVPDITFEGILEKSVSIIPNGLKYSHDAYTEIQYGNKVLRSPNYKETSWSFTAPIKIRNKKLGYVKVGYLTEKPNHSRDAFHLNEKLLIKTIAEKLGQVIEYLSLEQKLAACDPKPASPAKSPTRQKKTPPKE